MSDLIDRQAAIDAVNGVLSHYIPLFRNDQEGIPLECARAIMKLPSVQPRKGKWMNRRLLYMDVHMATCDQCGKRVVVGNFCPDCGSYNGGTSDDR